ncbi:alkanesulfonate monooxygenase SsuD/methylene tetrahydromethanopterin reductase-like flavin-dependent oxidoreductase (luciferase family) [Salana multivorans]|uniref:Alkanesulfonate monooxygenase SsuD/methylene tetrahydromethanopterin reductase-like flavin-dependent oxidoreductase (Luciferase family) n=1 Tax=Salana multivorans TaxID=120377 RepID=A0A3N2D9Z9_9MICO|nr:LLM class flavin-dependent oxidoreductase [Salana multivorans]MBN8881432.1 LLM class flavin-dependent oxidoreductase [Salana multivorans]OJX95425.1 MAG: luciferase [Micrococcales bacterium 73-15]ROR96543.1 alkanesulfonate monooxygenase SsuD/methylene tetrahydromethanopterin reductase-like flavin-dependent oxidoreductase (luciferase family) [Salana multivorans]
MRFQVLDIVFNPPHPLTGETLPADERLARVVENAVLAEELGIDAYAIGERHAGPVLSSAPTVILAAVAQATERILLNTGVTVLSLLDPVRVAEDLATIDQLSRGRLEITIGKGNEVAQYPLFGKDLALQYEYLTENYELLRRLLAEEEVTWEGRFRAPLEGATTLPRPYDGPFRIWHGTASSSTAVELAARWGDPIFTANALQPRENYLRHIEHYREEYARHGWDPGRTYLGSGSGGLFLAATTERAVEQYRPLYEGQIAQSDARGHKDVLGKGTSFRSIEEAVERGPALVGSSERVAEKILDYHATYGHDVQSISLNPALEHAQQQDLLRQFAEEVVPLVRREVSTTLWGPQDSRRPASLRREQLVA